MITLGLLLALAQPQDPTADALARFQAMPAAERATLVHDLERRVMLDFDDTIQAIVSMSRRFESYPLATEPTFHDPAKWAKGVAPPRHLIRAGTEAYRAVRAAIPDRSILPDLHEAVHYDWATGKVVRRAEPLSDLEVFQNLLAGYPPGSDEAVARILAMLDTDPAQRAMAAYLKHLYADLNGRVYDGITLYEAWYSHEVLDVPDVDAIPFARSILHDRSFHSPIPASRRRAWLYQQIRDRTLAFRKYRTLREAAAAAFVRAEPILDETYARLVPRFHYLYAVEDNRPERLAEKLRGLPDRAAFIELTDRAVKGSQEAYQQREARKAALQQMADKLRRMAMGG